MSALRIGSTAATQQHVAMETDSLLMDDVPSGCTVSHRRSSGSILSRSSSSRHIVRDSSDEELLEIDQPSPDATHTDDRPQSIDP